LKPSFEKAVGPSAGLATELPFMRELHAETIAPYLRDTGRAPKDVAIVVKELTGGVSNVVLRAQIAGRPPIVIKQCRERLRVAMPWHARLDRIWAERAALELLAAILPAGMVPQVLFEDRPNYLFAMTCAPDDSVTWKTLLMGGQADAGIAARLGTALGTIHAEAPRHPALRQTLADTSLFDELRIDPYYRTAARAHPDLAPRIGELIASMDIGHAERTLVLGDFSPKNILVHRQGLVLLDFECAHCGDAAFDLGFFLTHLVLKAIHFEKLVPGSAPRYLELTNRFWTAYLDRIAASSWRPDELVPRAIAHTAACMLARVDGKSPVEYLDADTQDIARRLAIEALQGRPQTWQQMRELVMNQLQSPR
jgi:5-methylthioribose kinase